MADTKLSALATATPVGTDIVYLLDDPGGTPSSKKATVSSLINLFTVSEGDVTDHEAALTITESQISDLGSYLTSAPVTSVAGEVGVITAGELRTAINVADGATANTTESIQDIVGAMVSGNTETLISVTYQDGDATMDFILDDDLSGYDNSASNFITSAGAPIQSVAGETGSITAGDLRTALNVADGATANTTESIQDVVGAMLTGNTETGITVTYQDADGTIDFVVSGGGGGDDWGDAVDADIVPDADGTRDLGTTSARFAELHVDSIDLNGTTLDGTTLADPGADRLLFWDDSAGATAWLTAGTGLTITGTTIAASGSGEANTIDSDPAGVTGADQVTNVMSLTTSEFGAITPNSSTVYLITDAS